MSDTMASSARLLAALLLLGLGAAPAGAQSIFANRGLGLVSEPVDARGSGLGGVQLGLGRGEISWSNPAEMTGLLAPGLRAVFQMDDFSTDYGTRRLSGSTARFPLIVGAFPFGRWVLSAGYGSFLDQNWAIEQTDTMVFGGDSTLVIDRLSSQGGVARLRVGASYMLTEPISLGLALDAYTGVSQREFGRFFDPAQRPPCCTVEWRYTGFGATAGAAWSPSEALDVSAAASFGGTLEAESDSAGIAGGSYSIPTSFRLGGSGQVTPNTLVAASIGWTGWGTLDDELASVGGARDAWNVSGGIEWDGVRLRETAVPVRLGARYSAMPFSWGQPGASTAFPDERALTAGLGLTLAGGAARGDLSFELGRRGGTDAGISETFSRIVFSVTALGR